MQINLIEIVKITKDTVNFKATGMFFATLQDCEQVRAYPVSVWYSSKTDDFDSIGKVIVYLQDVTYGING